jgi:hypothetical protein
LEEITRSRLLVLARRGETRKRRLQGKRKQAKLSITLEDARTELASTTTALLEDQLRVRVVERQVEEHYARNQELDEEKEKVAKAVLQVKRLQKDSAEAAATHKADSEKQERARDDEGDILLSRERSLALARKMIPL